ncbi:MAG: hypothetical protein HYY96_12755 [Candidatus Tectomicrobia bacterium]|nr:hypothetical protein [Candidatus Tectomicrobia bacterium]
MLLAAQKARLTGPDQAARQSPHLRVQDVDFSRNEILVRDGKGAKDRMTLLPESLKALLQEHMKKVKTIHEWDLADGWGRVATARRPRA